MRERFLIAVMAVFAFAYAVTVKAVDRHVGKESTERYHVAWVMRAADLCFEKSKPETAFIFQFEKGDSIQIDCPDCLQGVAGAGKLVMQLKGKAGNQSIGAGMLGKWLPLPSDGGKIAFTIGRDGFGERVLKVPVLSILRKSVTMVASVAGRACSLVQVRDLCLPEAAQAGASAATTLYFTLRDEDSYRMAVVDPSGGQHVLASVFKAGEEYAKQPCVLGAVAALPSSGSGQGQFGFAFAGGISTKGYSSYYISIDRIPLRSTGESIPQDK